MPEQESRGKRQETRTIGKNKKPEAKARIKGHETKDKNKRNEQK